MSIPELDRASTGKQKRGKNAKNAGLESGGYGRSFATPNAPLDDKLQSHEQLKQNAICSHVHHLTLVAKS